MQNHKVSVIVPCYNAAEFISETLQSILSQQRVDIEVIVVNDGSTDSSEKVIRSINDDRLHYYSQENRGVSSARNLGFSVSTGEYVIFFDSDDIMTPDFISSRVSALDEHPDCTFAGGLVQKFNVNGLIPGSFRGPDNHNFYKQLFLYDPQIITCPSNFIFRTEFLKKNVLMFNVNLSSTADRYFLIQCRHYGTSYFDPQMSPLYYRVNVNSMSNNFSKSLVADNELFYRDIKRNNLIPLSIKVKSLFYGYYILSGANYKVNNYYFAIQYGIRAFLLSPIQFVRRVLNK
jgi:glycosyltransferase involved in cell wall biosynthesis